jgi:hypothetical protein
MMFERHLQAIDRDIARKYLPYTFSVSYTLTVREIVCFIKLL